MKKVIVFMMLKYCLKVIKEKILDVKMDIFYNLTTELHYNYGKIAGGDAGIAHM